MDGDEQKSSKRTNSSGDESMGEAFIFGEKEAKEVFEKITKRGRSVFVRPSLTRSDLIPYFNQIRQKL